MSTSNPGRGSRPAKGSPPPKAGAPGSPPSMPSAAAGLAGAMGSRVPASKAAMSSSVGSMLPKPPISPKSMFFFTRVRLWSRKPVPVGTRCPRITFSLRPTRKSRLPAIAASVSTLVVSWKEAAEMKESEESDALVTPNRRVMPVAGLRLSRRMDSLAIRKAWRSTMAPGRKAASPGSVTCTLRIICERMISMCLSSMTTDWLR